MVGSRLPDLLVGSALWIFSSVAFPVYSKTRTFGPSTFRQAMLRALTLTTLFAFPVGIGLALVARDTILVFFSTKWAPAVGPMVALSLAAGLSSVGYASGDIFPALGRPGTLLRINAATTFVSFAGMLFFVRYGMLAVAWVQVGMQLLYAVVRLTLANRLLGSQLSDCLVAMRPAFSVGAGILVLALPVRLVLPAGAASLAALLLVGTLGALVGLYLGSPSTLGEVRSISSRIMSFSPQAVGLKEE
jgi:lipopolysaccharide exporter